MKRKRSQVKFDDEDVLSRILDESDDGEENYDDSDAWLSEVESAEEYSGEEVKEATSSSVVTPKSTSKSRRRTRQQEKNFEWGKVRPLRTIHRFGGGGGVTSRSISASSSPLDCFLQFFTVQILSLIVEMTNLNAGKKLEDINTKREIGSLDPLVFEPISVEEIKVFLGLVIAMGIVKMPVLAMYWQKRDWIFDIPSFNKIMPRDRFDSISRFLHFCDEADAPSREDPKRDKLYKLRPLLNLFEPRLMAVYRPSREISIDELLISFKGKIPFRQFVKSKRACVGMKVWVLAESKTGYISRLQFYTGEDSHALAEVDPSTRAVKDLITPFEHLNYHLYVDDAYTSPDLFASLLERGVYACGTIRTNRKDFPNDLIVKQVSEVPRGFSDWRTSGQLLAQSWVGNKAEYFLSTIHEPVYPVKHSSRNSVKLRGGHGGTHSVRNSMKGRGGRGGTHSGRNSVKLRGGRGGTHSSRNSVKLRGGRGGTHSGRNSMKGREGRGGTFGDTEVRCPSIFVDYNTHMGLSNQMRKYHNMTRKSKTWYRRVFSYLLEISLHNARVVFEVATGKKLDGLEFRRQLVNELVGDFRSTRRPSRRSSESATLLRLQPGVHFPKVIGGQRVCVVCSKRYQMAATRRKVKSAPRSKVATSRKVKSPPRSTIICVECDVHLCVKPGKTCFQDYHEKVEYWR